jgi:hypothetical protein
VENEDENAVIKSGMEINDYKLKYLLGKGRTYLANEPSG